MKMEGKRISCSGEELELLNYPVMSQEYHKYDATVLQRDVNIAIGQTCVKERVDTPRLELQLELADQIQKYAATIVLAAL